MSGSDNHMGLESQNMDWVNQYGFLWYQFCFPGISKRRYTKAARIEAN